MLSFETIIKATLVIVALFVIIIIATNLFPDVMKNFFEVTHLSDFLDVGKEKHESDFEVPETMEQNIEIIKTKILELSADDYKFSGGIVKLSIGTTTFDLSGKAENVEETEFENFEGSMLTIIKGKDGKSDIAYISVTDQILPSYESIKYTPCVVKAEEKGGCNPKTEFSERTYVDKILFFDANHFKIKGDEKKYRLEGLTKIDKDVCFVSMK